MDKVLVSAEYKAHIVQLAEPNGKLSVDHDPTSELVVKKKYATICNDIQSFGANVSSTTRHEEHLQAAQAAGPSLSSQS